MRYQTLQTVFKVEYKWLRIKKKSSMFLATMRMQIKTALTSYLIQVEITKINLKMRTDSGVDMKKGENWLTFCGNTKWCSCYGNQCGLPQKTRSRVTLWSRHTTQGTVPKDAISYYSNICSPILLDAPFLCQPINGCKLHVYQWMNK